MPIVWNGINLVEKELMRILNISRASFDEWTRLVKIKRAVYEENRYAERDIIE